MASRSSSDHPESLHPYHADRSRSMTSLESQGQRRTFLSRFLLSSQREGLLPLPEGAHLSSSSPPPCLPRILSMPLSLPHPASKPVTEMMAGDSMWATTFESSPPTIPVTILGTPTLQHPRPQLAQASSGIISPFHTAPISLLPAMAHLSTKPLPPRQPISNIEGLPQSGTNPSRPSSAHPSLYEKSRNPSPAPQHFDHLRPATGLTSPSSAQRFDPDITEDIGNESTGSSDQTHNLHQSYLRPLSRDMSTSPTRQVERAPSTSFHADEPPGSVCSEFADFPC